MPPCYLHTNSPVRMTAEDCNVEGREKRYDALLGGTLDNEGLAKMCREFINDVSDCREEEREHVVSGGKYLYMIVTDLKIFGAFYVCIAKF